MSHMVKIAGVPDKSDAQPGMAFFAGTGPIGTTCRSCRFRGYMRESDRGTFYKVDACEKFKKLSGHHGPDVQMEYASCKYYEPAPQKKAKR